MQDVLTRRELQEESALPSRQPWLRRLSRLLLLAAVGGAGLGALMIYRTRSNPPYTSAITLIQSDPQLLAHLGSPIRDKRWLPSGPYPEQFNLRVEGPKGEADVSVRARQFDGNWGLSAVDVVLLDGGARLSLETGTGADRDDAPAWSPGGGEGPPASDNGGLGLPLGVGMEPAGGPAGMSFELPETPADLNIRFPPIAAPPEP